MLFSRENTPNTNVTCRLLVYILMLHVLSRDNTIIDPRYHYYLYVCQFLDGSQPDSREIGRYCGLQLPDPVHSTGNQLRLEFHTDYSSNGHGFLFNWVATTQAPVSPTTPGPSTTAGEHSPALHAHWKRPESKRTKFCVMFDLVKREDVDLPWD